jgi:hypothetical protein
VISVSTPIRDSTCAGNVLTSVTTVAGAKVSVPVAEASPDVRVAVITNPATTANTRPIDAKGTTGQRQLWTRRRLLGRPEKEG